jgi:type I restriction enzyme, R subunit
VDSYRPSNQGIVKIQLVNEHGVVEPIPVTLKGGKPEPELDTLENILKVFNQRFGDIEWSDKDKVHKILVEQLPSEMEADSETMNAIKYSDKQNAKITSDKKIEDLMQQYLFTHTEIFMKFMSDQDFQRRYKEFIFDKLWHQRQANGSPSA